MDYASFKTYLTTFLWKAGDSVLIANLDNLISMANHELDRVLRVERRHTGDLLLVDALDVALPADYHAIRSLEATSTEITVTKFTYIEPSRLVHMRRIGQNRSWVPFYSIRNRTLMFSGPVADGPINVQLEYVSKIPDFAVTDNSWLADEFLDLYTYAVLKQSAMFLREDERLSGWQSLFADGVMQAIDDSEFNQTRGPSGPMPLPRTAGSPRRRR